MADERRTQRIAALNGPFLNWLRWRFAGEVEPGRVTWLDDEHPTLGQAVCSYTGDTRVSVYEKGFLLDATTTLAFDDIQAWRELTLVEVMHGNRDNSLVDFWLRTSSAGQLTLSLPFAQWTSLHDVLGELERRRNRPKRAIAAPQGPP